MKRTAALAALALLCACTSTSNGTHEPQSLPTLPPGGAFRDGLLYAAIKARLAGTDIDSTTRISVIVQNGVVTLRGTVADAATKEREAKTVRSMRGVKAVNDELRIGHVGPGAAQALTDAAVIAGVESALTAQAGINVTSVKVSADAGRVTLAGTAPTAAIKSTLLSAARRAPGVRNVVDRITVKE